MRVIIASTLIFIAGCTAFGALTPEDAYYQLRRACLRGDAEAVVPLLSKNTQQRMETIVGKINALDASRMEALATEMKISAGDLKNLTITKFISIQLLLEKKSPRIIYFLQSKPRQTTIHENRATLINEAGVMMKLVREGQYWKFEESVF